MAGKNVKMSSGTIYRTSEKGNYYFRYQINGKRKSISLGTRRIDEAKRKAEEIINVVSAPSVEVVAAHVKLAKGWSGNHPRLDDRQGMGGILESSRPGKTDQSEDLESLSHLF